MGRTLRGRIGIAFVAFALATLLAVGGALWIALRDLHRDAATGSLAELAAPFVMQVRQRLAPGPFRRDGQGDVRDDDTLTRLQDTGAFVAQVQQELEDSRVSVLLAREDGRVVLISSAGEVGVQETDLDVRLPTQPGDVQTGSTRVDGIGDALYAATPIAGSRLDGDITALVLVRPDDSARQATGDLVLALTLAALVLLVIGVPMALALSRSVTGPLGRLAAATGVVARGDVPPPLPVDGPAEVAHATAAFNAMAAEVIGTREAQRRLLADVRHDLRTPLTVIGGFAEALRDGTADGPAARRAADAIADEAARLERMLADLDQLTLPDGSLALTIEPLDGRELAAEAQARFAARAGSQGQEVVLDPAARPARLLADRDAVARILANLLDNALRHAPAPGGHARLEVAPVMPGMPPVGGPGGWAGRPGVVLAVHDDGPGIPPPALPHVFDRFYRVDPSRSGPGSGLGLAIVRDLADALGGRAFAENPRGGGARVGVVLPAAPVDVPARPAGTPLPGTGPSGVGGNTR